MAEKNQLVELDKKDANLFVMEAAPTVETTVIAALAKNQESKSTVPREIKDQNSPKFIYCNDYENVIMGVVTPQPVQRILRDIYHTGGFQSELGYLEGHKVVSDLDKRLEAQAGGSLLYGEVLPDGVGRLLDLDHLDASNAKVLYDFGMGTGRLCCQVFFQYLNLDTVVGIEISPARYAIGAAALRKLANRKGFGLVKDDAFRCAVIQTSGTRRRVLEFRCGDAFESMNPQSHMSGREAGFVTKADIIMLNTNFPSACSPRLCLLLTKLNRQARIATYNDVRKTYSQYAEQGGVHKIRFPLQQMSNNIKEESDRFLTSWAPKNGHHFYLWKVAQPGVVSSTAPP